jgi:hypothetical protein
MEKTNQGGYNIYAEDKELLREFNSKNSDSISLSTLGYIFAEAKVDPNKNGIVLLNLPETGFDWGAIIAVSGTLLGILLGSLATYLIQEKLYRKTSLTESRKEWIRNLQNIVSNILGTIRGFDFKIMVLLDTGDPITEKGMMKLSEELSQLMKNLEIKQTQLVSLININNKDEEELFLEIERLNEIFFDTIEIYLKNEGIVDESKKKNEHKNAKKMEGAMDNIKVLLYKIIRNEQSKL